MKTLIFTTALLSVLVSIAFSQYDWNTYGDTIPPIGTTRQYSEITHFLDLQGSGNDNAGNWRAVPQTDAHV
jgi:hypothetical protein